MLYQQQSGRGGIGLTCTMSCCCSWVRRPAKMRGPNQSRRKAAAAIAALWQPWCDADCTLLRGSQKQFRESVGLSHYKVLLSDAHS